MNWTSRRVLLPAFVLAVLGGGALMLPSYAHESDEPSSDTGYHERFDGQGDIIPEEPHVRNDKTVSDRAELRTIEEQLDPASSPHVFVCADPGDTEVTVVHEYPSLPSDKADLKPADKLGPIVRATDQCADKSMVVGN